MNLVDLPHEVAGRLNVLDLEPLKGYRFAVQIDGNIPGSQFIAGFSDVEGIQNEVEVRTISEGGCRIPHKFARGMRPNTITLRRGMVLSRKLWDWHQQAVNWTKGLPDYTRSLSVFHLDEISQPLGMVPYEAWRWDLHKAWVSKWDGPKFNAMNNSLAVESVTIQYQGITIGKGPLNGLTGELASLIT